MNQSIESEVSCIVLFDGVCNLCNRWVQFTIKRDRKAKFKFAALQSKSAQHLLSKHGITAIDFDSFVLLCGNHYFIRSTAVLMLLRELGGIWKWFYAFIIMPRSLRDFIYHLVARSRYKIFGRRESCIIPARDIQSRFLE